jgi:uncharacterized protein (DUF1919 family)
MARMPLRLWELWELWGHGRLANVRVLFLHYGSFNEALEKWERRKQRISFSNLLLVHTDRGGATPENLAAFDALPYAKLLFVSRPYPKLGSAVWIKNGNEPNQVGDWTTQAPGLTSNYDC